MFTHLLYSIVVQYSMNKWSHRFSSEGNKLTILSTIFSRTGAAAVSVQHLQNDIVLCKFSKIQFLFLLSERYN